MNYKEQFDNAYTTVKATAKFEAQIERLRDVIRRHANACLPQPVAATLIDGIYAAAMHWGFDDLDLMQECIQLLDPELDLDPASDRLIKDWADAPSSEQWSPELLMCFLEDPSSGFGENEDLPDFVPILYHSFGLMSMLLSAADGDEAVADVIYNIRTEIELFWSVPSGQEVSQFCDIADSLQ